MTSLNVKIQIPNSSWNEISGKNVKVAALGTCKVCQIEDTLLLLIGDITYAVKEGMPVVLQSIDNRMVFIFQSEKDEILFGLSTLRSRSAQEFATILRDMMRLEEADEKEEKESSSKVQVYGNKLVSVISKGGKIGMDVIDKGTEKTKKGINVLTEKAKEKIPKAEKPLTVSSGTKAKIEKAKLASVMAVTVSSSMLKGAMEAADQVASQLKPVLSSYLEEKGLKSDKPRGPKTETAITVGKHSVKTALDLYFAMREASIVLLEATMDASADLIEHRYGNDAGAAARDVAEAGKNALQISRNIGATGMKQTAKRVLADTALKALESPENERQVREQKEAAIVLTSNSAMAMD